MTMTIPAGGLRSARRPSFLDALRAAWAAHRRRREHLLALRQLDRLGPRLLADAGIDPALARAAADPWEHLPPSGFLMQR
jgi:uncharacterized protein YjiS (DUF1127 family)